MTNFIHNFIDHNEKVLNFLEQVGRDYENADKNLTIFKDFLFQTKYNPVLGLDLTSCLQLLNKEENFSDFELVDICRLFDSLMKLQEFNIDTYLEAGNFEWSVMDNREKALEIIKSGLTKATEKTEELKRLLKTIEKES